MALLRLVGVAPYVGYSVLGELQAPWYPLRWTNRRLR